MGNLSEFVLPDGSKTVKSIYDWHVEQSRREPPRGYLGASVLGHECDRYLWYNFRGCVSREVQASPGDHPGRVYRLFKTGHLAEPRFAEELRGIGCEVVEFDGVDDEGRPKQIGISMLSGHLRGHLDAAVLGLPEAPKTWHVAEFKTHGKKSFGVLKSKGVKAAKPEHWAQMQVYMGGSGMRRALYLAVCKDTDELYAERVKFDTGACQALLDRGARIIRAKDPPERIANRPDDWRCRFCAAKTLCHDLDDTRVVALLAITCRTCCHATPETEDGGGWSCSKFGVKLEDTRVGADCPAHLLLPGIVGREPVDAGDDWIEFKYVDKPWRHGAEGSGNYTTKDLISGRGPYEETPLDGDEPETLIDAYPWEDSRLLWSGKAADLKWNLVELGYSSELLNTYEPLRTQATPDITAAEYRVGVRDILVVVYEDVEEAAVWEGKA